jgi:hypothetical protein
MNTETGNGTKRKMYPARLGVLVLLPIAFLACESRDLSLALESVDAPSFDAAAGLYYEPVQVKLLGEKGAKFRYTTNETASQADSSAWTPYSVPISVDRATTIRAYAYKDEANLSDVASAAYRIKVSAPSAEPAPGSYDAAVSVKLTSATAAALIRYTLDGTDPTDSNGTVIANGGSVPLSSTRVLKARAELEPREPSDAVQGSYFFSTIDVGLTLNLPGNLSFAWTVNSSPPPGTIDLPYGDDMVVAVTVPASFASPVYRWFLNGYEISGATSAALTVGFTGPLGLLAPGTYALTLEVAWGGGSYSCTENIEFHVVP